MEMVNRLIVLDVHYYAIIYCEMVLVKQHRQARPTFPY